MFFYRDRIESDIANIRKHKALLPKARAKDVAPDTPLAGRTAETKDTFAIILAVFSLIGPYVLGFIGVIGLLALWISG
ncbi:MAG: hypothetical protein LBO81_00680 [Clostridiales Family XIII bacterium]|jgi:hypothetical protein|nr:hypothetical protein [Clostridiales Family XIII bacterium]